MALRGALEGEVGISDLVLLSKLSDDEIVENLKKRFGADLIYTYIGSVLISVNPYRQLPGCDKDSCAKYVGKFMHEMNPHVFALAEDAYRTMVSEEESQCVIISGESGAGKTEASKLIMNYISAVSGSGEGVEKVKNIILESNPLLEGFGNAKTLRNNNSSRFGKYFQIQFDRLGRPMGGHITNYLLEKSRVVRVMKGERSYHCFYQLANGAPKAVREALNINSAADFRYLSQSETLDCDGVDEEEDFKAMRKAMSTVGLKSKGQEQVFRLVAAILHLGNIAFSEDSSGNARIRSGPPLQMTADLLGVTADELSRAILARRIEARGEQYEVPNNVDQASQARDAVAKFLYDRLFSWLVSTVNNALKIDSGDDSAEKLSVCVLDIYGFEVFEKNSLEQLCINYVNEKLQQIFIQLTLKQEQEEYVRENITWVDIPFFDNKVVCDLIEDKRLPGVFSLLDDVCMTLHAQAEGGDSKFLEKCAAHLGSHKHLKTHDRGFTIKHYAGDVEYRASGLCEKNKDNVTTDILIMVKRSSHPLLPLLFPEEVDADDKRRPTTAVFKLKQSAAELVKAVMLCNPHYIRCIKPNDAKSARQFIPARVKHQSQYLGLVESTRVRRAGYAARIDFHRFVERFAFLSSKTWPRLFKGSDKDAAKAIVDAVWAKLSVPEGELQFGKTKLFIKQPQTLFRFEKLREAKLGDFAARIQRTYRKFVRGKRLVQLRAEAGRLLQSNNKARQRESIFRPFEGDYIKCLANEDLSYLIRSVVEPTESVLFAENAALLYATADKVPAVKKRQVVLVCTSRHLLFVEDYGPNGGGHPMHSVEFNDKLKAVLAQGGGQPARRCQSHVIRSLRLTQISETSLSPFADDVLALHTHPLLPSPVHLGSPKERNKNNPNFCNHCGLGYSLTRRRHTCRLCARLFCSACCPKNVQSVPDIGYYSAERLCVFCDQISSTEILEDLLIQSSRRTELLAILRDAVQTTEKRDLRVQFRATIPLARRTASKEGQAPNTINHEVLCRESTAANEVGVSADRDSQSNPRLIITAPPGLGHDVVARLRKGEAARRKMREARRVEEEKLRAEANAIRQREHEELRKQRIAEKKAAKAARLAEEVARDQAAFDRQQKDLAMRKGAGQKSPPVGGGGGGARGGGGGAAAAAKPAVPACGTCGCSDFVPHAFKKNQCGTCFHAHA